jgi:hypothetical protein
MEDRPMDEHTRRDTSNNGRSHSASNRVDDDDRDDVNPRRDASREEQADDRGGGRPALTNREREERWPIG